MQGFGVSLLTHVQGIFCTFCFVTHLFFILWLWVRRKFFVRGLGGPLTPVELDKVIVSLIQNNLPPRIAQAITIGSINQFHKLYVHYTAVSYAGTKHSKYSRHSQYITIRCTQYIIVNSYISTYRYKIIVQLSHFIVHMFMQSTVFIIELG